MTALHTLDVGLYAALAGAGLDQAERDRVVTLCEDVVAMVPGLGLPHPGQAVRSAVQLMLSESAPHLAPRVRDDVARLCEVALVLGA